ncbi:formimidoylglutamate deiminase [Dongia soli]|uniref:Formimidoylglutamate deiminase n=1 Tax=Dongia soli TaxID=600628 RepID=A0ABU5E9V5_9PROT|nr:formimidoylglutamate deiminase [Dongia soli]MDY0882983.1 formimidoylglutamate deiminase [Dongia soli]
MKSYIAERALLPQGWAENVLISLDDKGFIADVSTGTPRDRAAAAQPLSGPVLPGMPNLHSHAFQRAMAGLTESALNPEDSFWTWRDLMYRLVGRLNPEQVEAIASYLYIDMLKAGYTSVAEFHYLHHNVDGRPYADPAEMAKRVLAAADRTGIGITLLPVMYAHGGFGGKEPAAGQRRFLHQADDYLKLLQNLAASCDHPLRRLGACFHSLRAVTPDEMKTILGATDDGRPVHIHIAEQQKEVDDCLAWSGKRPIQWLYDEFAVDQRWCLIHATHADDQEVTRMAKSGAVVGICPTTEANLGDGLFPAIDYARQGGRFGVGSDSHVSLSVVEELRWLEYGQRLKHERRNRLYSAARPNIGAFLYDACVAGGAQAVGQPVGRIATGQRADLVVLNGRHPLMAHISGDDILSRWLFGGTDRLVKDVMVGGAWVVQEGHHAEEEAAGHRFADVIKAAFSQ